VLDVSAERIGLENEKGRRIELDGGHPLHLEHAYATTVHSAQGLSTDRMMVDLDTRSLTTGKDLYYVAISRARYEATVYTNSRTELPAAISREPVKTAALDIQREREAPRLQTCLISMRKNVTIGFSRTISAPTRRGSGSRRSGHNLREMAPERGIACRCCGQAHDGSS
jgi:hypothetical protein